MRFIRPDTDDPEATEYTDSVHANLGLAGTVPPANKEHSFSD